MNVLLIGGCSNVINNLIIKLNKEGHRIYLLTGSRYEKQPYQRVFEKYHFPYDAGCLNEIFESINPDLTVFMGAYDTNFHWDNEESEAVRYSACVMNILMAYAMKNKGRFIYLSSDEVYQGDFSEDISEETPTAPQGFKSMVLSQAEEMCESYGKNCDRDIIVLRLDHLYSMPDTMADVTDICTKMCLESLDKYIITVDDNDTFSLLYVTDAVEYLYRLAVCETHKYHLYNLSSETPVTERQLAELVRKNMWFNVEIVSVGTNTKRKILSSARFAEEFKPSFLCDTPHVVARIVARMKKYRHIFLYGEKRKKTIRERILERAGWLTKTAIPYIENGICFVIFFMLNNRAVGSKYFHSLDFYLLYVLLFAIVYGQQQATLSAALAVAGYCFRQMYDRSGFELMLDSNTYVWIAQLFILGLAVGYMRDYITKLKREHREEKEFLSQQLEDIKEINDSNVRVKDALETQIVNQNDSVGKIYSITSSLDQYSQEEVLFYAAEMIARLMKSRDVAIYTVSGGEYARLFSATSPKARSMGNSIRYKQLGEMYEALGEKKVFINRSLNDKYPLMANAIFEENEMQMIIMIWGIPWESMTLGQANQLVVISALIHNAVVRANKYLEALEEERYIDGTKILDEEAFTTLVNAYLAAEKKGLTECIVLKVEAAPDITYKDLAMRISARLRHQDYVGLLSDNRLYVLLSNARRQDAVPVMERLAAIGCRSEIMEEYEQ